MHLLKKTFLLFLAASVLCSSFPNTVQASNVSSTLSEVPGIPEESQNDSDLSEETHSDIMDPEETQNYTVPSETEPVDIIINNSSANAPEASAADTEISPTDSEYSAPTSIGEEPPVVSDSSETTTGSKSTSKDKSEQENELPDNSETQKEISEHDQNNTAVLTVDSEEKTSTIESYTEIYVNPLYADVLQSSDLVQPEDIAVAAYSNEEYLSTPEAAGIQLRSSMTQRQKTINIFYQVSVGQTVPVYDIMDHALIHTKKPVEGDYLRWNMGGYVANITGYKKDNIQYLTLQYTVTYHTTAEQEAELTTDIQQIIKQLSLNSKNDYEKICSIYDYICQNVSYDYTNLNDNTYMLKYTAYAALKHHTAVCQGYALLFYRLALEAGIDNRIISGTSSNQSHGWNIVCLDNVYYNVDSTWDAPRKQSGQDYVYFLKCDRNFSNHTRNSQYSDDIFYNSYPMGTDDYSLLKTDISSGTISLSNSSYIYDGTEKKPAITVRHGNKTLIENSDYRILYQNNLNVGKASVTVTGIGPYTGTLTAFFDIIRPADPQPVAPQPVLQGWKPVSENWYYYIDGIRQTGWHKVDGKWYYMDEHGIMKTGWLHLGNTWYYLKNNGAMATGWLHLDNTWYYLKGSGAMATGWLHLGSTWYYLKDSGAMATGWLHLGNTWYYLKNNGAMATGWLHLGNTWYYLKASGAMATGWLHLGSTWYYLNSSGAMASSDTRINGVLNRFNSNGVWLGT